jgi:hypothetical protein
LHVILLGKVVADVDLHGDALGIADLCPGRLVGLGPEFPAVIGAKHENRDAIRTIGINLSDTRK